MNKRYFILGLIYIAWGWLLVIPNSKTKVIFCDVGQGDAAIIISGYFQMMIDVGPENGGVEKCLDQNLPLGDKRLEIVLLSHWDSDHSGALDKLLNLYKIDKIVSGMGIAGGNDEKYIIDRVKFGDVIIGNNFKFKVIFPDEGLLERENDSVVGILNYSNVNILFTGDIDELVENSIIDRIEEKIDVIKMSHHGSISGNSYPWIDRVNANYAIVSVGKNTYGHPSAEVLNTVLRLGTSIVRTDVNGNLVVR